MTEKKIRVGIFFGGPSREREISFAGGRTVYDNLDKSLFDPCLYFVDSLGQLIELDWQYIYKGTIRDFYPPVQFLPYREEGHQVYIESLAGSSDFDHQRMAGAVGRLYTWHELKGNIDIAFLALHGRFGEDGQIQGILETLDIPYTGSGIRASAIGMDKCFQKKLMTAGGFDGPPNLSISRQEWTNKAFQKNLFERSKETFGETVVIRPGNQGSSIGVSILSANDEQGFMKAVDKAFFIRKISRSDYLGWSEEVRDQFVRTLSDIREGLGFPLMINDTVVHHPAEFEPVLLNQTKEEITLEAFDRETNVLLEGFVRGKEFSCIVIRNEDGLPLALPPTEIVKGGEVFDYRSKYLPGLSRKVTPIDLPESAIEAIRAECERLFSFLDFQVYARIDGFYQDDGKIILNDPNTTSGMMPSSFFFHQAAEIGLDPSAFLTYIIWISLRERIKTLPYLPSWQSLPERLENMMQEKTQNASSKLRVVVLLGGYSSERHISIESGRNIYEKLASSGQFMPVPVFLSGTDEYHELHILPINLLLKDNADDIRQKIQHPTYHPVIQKIRNRAIGLTNKFGSGNLRFEPQPIQYASLTEICDFVFIALHGRPGEDGDVQARLDVLGIPFNGSDTEASRRTIDKYATLQTLKAHGFKVANQYLAQKTDWQRDQDEWLKEIERSFSYPLIAKPVDDGCSSAVKLIRSREELITYANAIYRNSVTIDDVLQAQLDLKPREEFPQKSCILIESLITKADARHFLEITGGLLTSYKDGKIHYEVFEPSEALSGNAILSLEEKFLAGEGQNITPARFDPDSSEQQRISGIVRKDLERVARILNIVGYARIDAFVKIMDDGRVETWIIEVNSLPGMTPATCIFHQAAINSYRPSNFIEKIIAFGIQNRKMITHA